MWALSVLDSLGQGLGYGLVTASIIAVSAIGLSLQFSVTKVPNFAHGELMTYGAYGAYFAGLTSPSLLVGVIGGVVVGGLLGLTMNKAVFEPFSKLNVRPIYLLVVTAALSITLQNLLALFFGVESRYFTPPPAFLQPMKLGPVLWSQLDLYIMLSALAAIVLTYLLLNHTRFGSQQRAVADDPELARVSGIEVPRIINLTWMLAGALAGLSGVALAWTFGSIVPTVGYSFLLLIFAAAIAGGIGRIDGAVLGALVVGLVAEVWATFGNAAYKPAVATVFLLVALLLRPKGLLPTSQELI